MQSLARMPTARRGARQRVAAWRLAVCAILCFALLLDEVTAFAAVVQGSEDYRSPRVYYKPSDTSYLITAPSNQFDAALAVIGKGNARIQLTNDKLALLSNASTGGDFYVLSTYMRCAADSEPAWADSVNNFVASSRFFTAKGMYGSQFVWWADNVTSDLRRSALDDFNDINNSSGGAAIGSLTFGGGIRQTNSSPDNARSAYYYWIGDSSAVTGLRTVSKPKIGSNVTWQGATVEAQALNSLTVNMMVGESLSDVLGDWPLVDCSYAIWIQRVTSYSSYPCRYSVDLIVGRKEDFSYSYDVDSVSGNRYLKAVDVSGRCYVARLGNVGDLHNYVTVLFDGTTMSLGNVAAFSSDVLTSYSRSPSTAGAQLLPLTIVGDEQGPLPPNNWPEPVTPPSPGPPEVPEPDIDPTPEPQSPTVDVDTEPGNINITVTVEPGNTTPADYTPWLRAILQALNNTLTFLGTMLNSIRADLTDHCNHIRQCIEENTLYLASSIGYKIQGIFDDYKLYVKSLFEWLAQQFDWSFTNVGYDDSSIVMWLRRIYQRLSGGTPSIPDPSEPGADGGYLDWLWEMIHNLLIDLLMIGGGALDGIVETIGDLIHLFPISVPWDIAALLALFAAEPVTPAFEYDLSGEVYSWSYDFVISVDLHWLDEAMGTVRTLELISFAGFLLWRTKDLLEIFDWVGLSKQ